MGASLGRVPDPWWWTTAHVHDRGYPSPTWQLDPARCTTPRTCMTATEARRRVAPRSDQLSHDLCGFSPCAACRAGTTPPPGLRREQPPRGLGWLLVGVGIGLATGFALAVIALWRWTA